MILKILSVLVVAFLIYLFFFKSKRQEEVKKAEKPSKELEGETMVECHQCATFVSAKEAIIKDAHFFCSKECAGVPR